MPVSATPNTEQGSLSTVPKRAAARRLPLLVALGLTAAVLLVLGGIAAFLHTPHATEADRPRAATEADQRVAKYASAPKSARNALNAFN